MADKLKVLWYSDTPCCATGFGNVARNILRRLYDTGRYEFYVLGINHGGCYDQKKYPYWIEPAGFNPDRDMFGRQNLAKLIQRGGFDIFFSLQDLGTMASFVPVVREAREDCNFRWIAYSPLDVPWANKALLASFFEADYPVCYTKWAYDIITGVSPAALALKVKTIYHGTDPQTFHPLPMDRRRELRRSCFDLDDDTFLVVNVNRNQWRKDLARTMRAFKLWKERYGHKAVLYLHAKVQDHGGNLRWQAANAGLDLKRDIVFSPEDFGTLEGVAPERLNEIYNCADVIVSTTLGEGWGFSCTEAFATMTPVLMPRNSSLVEMVGEREERGWLAASGTNPSLWTVGYGESDLARPLVDIEDWAFKLEQIHQCVDLEERVEAAYTWAQEHTWDIICRDWARLFREASP